MTEDEHVIWDQLLAEQPIPDVRASPIGLAAWHRLHPGDACRIVVAREHDRPVALAALCTSRMSWRKLRARRVAPAGDLHWRCGYAITGRNVPAAIGALLDEVLETRGWDVLWFGPMLADGPTRVALVAEGRARGMRPSVVPAGPGPRVVFDGTWDAYYASRSANLRSMVSRGERRLRALGPLSLEEHRGVEGLDDALEAFHLVEASGWKGREGSAIASDPALRTLYHDLAHDAAARGRLRLYLLRSGDHVVAGDYCLEHDGVIYMLKTGYDEEFSRCSPGQVLRKLVLARLWASGEVSGYDLMPGGGDHGDYKRRWANDVRPYAEVRLYHPRSVRGQALAGLLRLKHTVAAYSARRHASPAGPPAGPAQKGMSSESRDRSSP